MSARMPAALPLIGDYIAALPAMGRMKSDGNAPRDLNKNCTADEYNQQNLEIIATATKVGIDAHDPMGTSGAIARSHDFLLNRFMAAARQDRQGFLETFQMDPALLGTFSAYLVPTGMVPAVVLTVAGSVAALSCGCVAATPAIISQTALTYESRSSYFAARYQIDALPDDDTDFIALGLWHDATHYVLFTSQRAAGVWPNWTVGVNDGGAVWTSLLTTGNPADVVGAWGTFEIVTTNTGAYFYYNRGAANAEYRGPGVQAPPAVANNRVTPYINTLSTDGGETYYLSAVACSDTRTLFGS